MPDNEFLTRYTSLSEHIVSFCRYLRRHDFILGPDEETTSLYAISLTAPYGNLEMLKEVLSATIVKKVHERDLFDTLFTEYWTEYQIGADSKIKMADTEDHSGFERANNSSSLDSLKEWLWGKDQNEEKELAFYSPNETLSKKDFSEISADEVNDLHSILKKIARILAARLKRRQMTSQRGNFDLRKTIRTNLKRGGEIIDIRLKNIRKSRLKLVLICDVSKSMELYTRFLITFMHTFQTLYKRIESFVFSTRLYHISPLLRENKINKALSKIGEFAPAWSGGTTIGKSLQTFVDDYALRYLDNNTVVIIMSDGWDSGDTVILRNAMEQIHQKAGKIIWLNPLAGNPSFKPMTTGMITALPYIDVFSSGHNADGLSNLMTHLMIVRKHFINNRFRGKGSKDAGRCTKTGRIG